MGRLFDGRLLERAFVGGVYMEGAFIREAFIKLDSPDFAVHRSSPRFWYMPQCVY